MGERLRGPMDPLTRLPRRQTALGWGVLWSSAGKRSKRKSPFRTAVLDEVRRHSTKMQKALIPS